MRWLAHLFALFLSAQAAAAENVVTWIHIDEPPIHIIDGKYKGTGYGDRIEGTLRAKLKGFTHRTEIMPLPRAVAAMKRKNGYCFIAAKRTSAWADRLQMTDHPVLPSMTVRLLFHPDDLARFAAYRTTDGSIDLDALVKVRGFRFGYKPKMSYSPHIDALMAKVALREEVYAVPNQKLLYEMFRLRRIDFLPALVEDATYYWRRKAQDVDFIALPVAGQNYVDGRYLACSDDRIGRAVVSKINSLLNIAGRYPPYMHHYEAWIDSGSRDRLRAYFNRMADDLSQESPTS